MGLDITISERKEYRCPNCGIHVGHTDITSTDSNGTPAREQGGHQR